MKVAVTGGTGFVGSHTVRALVASGYEVRLLVRDAERIAPALDPLGVGTPDEVVVGSVTSMLDVETLLEGCDAVVHSASVYSLDTRDAAAIRDTNVTGTRHVIEAARRLSLDPIVHVSSVVAVVPADRPVGPDSPTTTKPGGVYGASKAESELLARQHQADGAPVVTVMPATVWGPDDPYLGESNRIASDFLGGRLRTVPRSASFGIVDVRDVAQSIANIIEPGRGPRRYLLSPYDVALHDLVRHLNRLTDRHIRTITLSDRLARFSVAPVGLIQRVSPFRLPLSLEGVNVALGWVPTDSGRAVEELGITWRSLDATLADTITSMVERGELSAKQAGQLARR